MQCESPFLAAAASLLVAGGLLSGCISTATYGTGESPELAIFREISGGFGSPKKDPIEYQPRAPLVLPPSATAGAATLPPPVETASLAAADWPSDPDEKVTSSFDDPERAVTREDAQRLAPLAGLGPVTRDSDPNDTRNPTFDVIGKQAELSAFRAAVDAENAGPPAGERQYLTQPPTTYMEPASTAPTEFEDIDKKKKGGIFCITCWF